MKKAKAKLKPKQRRDPVPFVLHAVKDEPDAPADDKPLPKKVKKKRLPDGQPVSKSAVKLYKLKVTKALLHKRKQK